MTKQKLIKGIREWLDDDPEEHDCDYNIDSNEWASELLSEALKQLTKK